MRNPFSRAKTPNTSLAPAGDQERSGWNPYLGLDPAFAVGQTLVSSGPLERPAVYWNTAAVFRSNPVVYACVDVRVSALAEVRFQFNARKNGRPTGFFGSPALLPLEVPWPGGTTRELVAQLVMDHDLAGNAYAVLGGTGCVRLRPDWVSIVFESSTGDPNGWDSTVVGYTYQPGGAASGAASKFFFRRQVAHWRGLPDPSQRFLGLSWIAPALGAVSADVSISEFTSRFFDNGAAVSMVVTAPPDMSQQEMKLWNRTFNRTHGGPAQAHKPLFLANGATATTVGADPKSSSMRELQGGNETRMCSAAGVPPVIAGVSEGLSSTSYASYDASRRRFADYTLMPALNGLTDALSNLVVAPPGKGIYLAFDPRDISHFQEDRKDASTIQQADAATISTLFNAGFTPESCVAAVSSGELTQLVHTGALPVQVQPLVAEPALAAGESSA